MGAVRQCGWAADCTRPTSKAATWPGRSSAGVTPPEPGGAAVGIDTRGGYDDRDRGHGVAVTRPCVKRPSHPPLVGQAVFQPAIGRRGVGSPSGVWHSAERRSLFGGGQTGQNVKIRPAFPLNATWHSSSVFRGQTFTGKAWPFRWMAVSRRVHDYYSAVRFWGRGEQVGS